MTQIQKTGADGRYIFNIVLPGAYTLRSTATGFRPAMATGINVEVNKTTVPT